MPLPPSPYPVALVEFEGQPVPPDAVRSLTLERNVEYLADSLEVILDNAKGYSDFIAKERPVEVWMGYVANPTSWHKSELTHVFSGAVDGVLPDWSADTTLKVACRDHTRLLIDEQADPSWPWQTLTDSQVVADLAQRAGLVADITATGTLLSEQEWTSFPGMGAYATDVTWTPVVAPSGWDIIQQLAVRNGYIASVTVDKRLYFGPRGGLGAVPVLGGVLGAVGGSIGTWTYFEEPFDLLAVQFDDSALVVNKVTVVRWQPLAPGASGQLISGSAVDAGRLKAARGRVVEKTLVSTRADSEAACTAEARARLSEFARAAITATATVEGDPRLVGDAKVTLAGAKLGRFKGDYYVVTARHRFGTDGYTTEMDLSSVLPEASEVYRPTLTGEQMTPEQAAAAQQATTATVPTCGDAPVDYAAAWPEFGGGIEGLLEANGLPPGAAHATCGPIAAAGMLKAFGIATDPGKLAAVAYKGDADGKWWTGQGMAGPDSEVKLLVAAGLAGAKNLGLDIAEAVKRASACQPVIFDTPEHYILASAYRADGRFFGGVTISNAMKQSGGNPWASVAEINSYGLGSIRSVIVADVAAPTASGTGHGGNARTAGAFDAAPDWVRAVISGGGWPSDQWDNAAAIAKAESSYDAGVVNSIGATGLFQIYVAVWHKETADFLGLPEDTPQSVITERLKDPLTNSQMAHRIWKSIGHWGHPSGWDTAAGLGLA